MNFATGNSFRNLIDQRLSINTCDAINETGEQPHFIRLQLADEVGSNPTLTGELDVRRFVAQFLGVVLADRDRAGLNHPTDDLPRMGLRYDDNVNGTFSNRPDMTFNFMKAVAYDLCGEIHGHPSTCPNADLFEEGRHIEAVVFLLVVVISEEF